MTVRHIIGTLVVGVAIGGLLSAAHAQVLVGEQTWITDGNVRTVVRGGGRLYLGGDFGYVGPATGAAVVLDADSGAPVVPPAELTGVVQDAVSDGGGGWYVGRDLRSDALEGPSLVHLLADGSVGALALPQPDGPIFALARAGNTLYLAGDFASVSGQARGAVAAVDLASRALLAWNPAVSGTTTGGARGVFDLLVLDTGVALAGNFDHVAGAARRDLAAVDAVTDNRSRGIPIPTLPSTRSRARVRSFTSVAFSVTSPARRARRSRPLTCASGALHRGTRGPTGRYGRSPWSPAPFMPAALSRPSPASRVSARAPSERRERRIAPVECEPRRQLRQRHRRACERGVPRRGLQRRARRGAPQARRRGCDDGPAAALARERVRRSERARRRGHYVVRGRAIQQRRRRRAPFRRCTRSAFR